MKNWCVQWSVTIHMLLPSLRVRVLFCQYLSIDSQNIHCEWSISIDSHKLQIFRSPAVLQQISKSYDECVFNDWPAITLACQAYALILILFFSFVWWYSVMQLYVIKWLIESMKCYWTVTQFHTMTVNNLSSRLTATWKMGHSHCYLMGLT